MQTENRKQTKHQPQYNPKNNLQNFNQHLHNRAPVKKVYCQQQPSRASGRIAARTRLRLSGSLAPPRFCLRRRQTAETEDEVHALLERGPLL
ncbi:MAG: hypothetical protein ACYSOI_09320, partial [Planctomycetota bacterium]